LTEIKEGPTKGEIKGRSFRIGDEAYEYFQKVAKESGLTQADLMNEFVKSYQRLQLEKESSYGQALEDLRSYSDKIINLFTTVVNSTDDRISNEQDKAIELEEKLKRQILMTQRAKDDSAAKVKFLENQVAELTAKLKEYASIDEMIDLRLKDKDELLESKDKEIANLHKELEEWKHEGENFEKARVLNGEVKDKLTATEKELKLTQDQLRAKDFEMQQQLLALEKKHNEEIKAMLKERAQEIKDAEERVRAFYEAKNN
jgi:chromosome segregation ATPase